MSKTIVIIGDGGREDALRRSFSGYTVHMLSVAQAKLDAVCALDPDLVLIGSELPLVDGLADLVRAKGIAVFGPSRAAAQLEGSKSHAENFMDRYNIPRPRTSVITPKNKSDYILPDDPCSVVLKADKLAGGKGVVLPKSSEEAHQIFEGMYSGKLFGGAGKDCVVVQERLHGPEVSVFALTDGTNYVTLPYTQDHKRLRDGDEGPNTGGMGAYAPVPYSVVSKNQRQQIDSIVRSTIDGMRSEGNEYRGIVYVGIMLAEERGGDPIVIEYNVRFGDPEAQVLLPLLESAGIDIYTLLLSTDSVLEPGHYRSELVEDKAALTVCLAANGYPEKPIKGDEIHGLEGTYEGATIFYGAVSRRGSKYETNGGRVIYITGMGDSIENAAKHAYSAIGHSGVHFSKMQYRRDIGWQARGHASMLE